MDILKTGIGLRGYNQKDPLTEYKKESYNLFMELVNRLKTESVRTLQIVKFKSEEPDSNPNQTPNESVKIDKKPSRNSPCPCGSGAKFKECCGKSGPKKGVFA